MIAGNEDMNNGGGGLCAGGVDLSLYEAFQVGLRDLEEI
jgi:hypothetical protein